MNEEHPQHEALEASRDPRPHSRPRASFRTKMKRTAWIVLVVAVVGAVGWFGVFKGSPLIRSLLGLESFFPDAPLKPQAQSPQPRVSHAHPSTESLPSEPTESATPQAEVDLKEARLLVYTDLTAAGIAWQNGNVLSTQRKLRLAAMHAGALKPQARELVRGVIGKDLERSLAYESSRERLQSLLFGLSAESSLEGTSETTPFTKKLETWLPGVIKVYPIEARAHRLSLVATQNALESLFFTSNWSAMLSLLDKSSLPQLSPLQEPLKTLRKETLEPLDSESLLPILFEDGS